jgi:hypothetical protein
MALDAQQVAASFRFDPEQIDELRVRWLRLLDLSVWGELKSAKIGAVPRLRKRLLELGESLRSLVSDRTWIPQPREQVKGAMGASLKLRDSVGDLERAAALIEGGADFPRFEQDLLEFRQRLLTLMEGHEHIWTGLLDSQYSDDVEDDPGS